MNIEDGSRADKSHGEERRKEIRITDSIDVDIVVSAGAHKGIHLSGQIENLHLYGAGIVTKNETEIGVQLEVTVYFLEEQSFFTGIVKWKIKVQDSFRYGLSIVKWGKIDTKLEQYIES
jgi:hypothetical protein